MNTNIDVTPTSTLVNNNSLKHLVLSMPKLDEILDMLRVFLLPSFAKTCTTG